MGLLQFGGRKEGIKAVWASFLEELGTELPFEDETDSVGTKD